MNEQNKILQKFLRPVLFLHFLQILRMIRAKSMTWKKIENLTGNFIKIIAQNLVMMTTVQNGILGAQHMVDLGRRSLCGTLKIQFLPICDHSLKYLFYMRSLAKIN